MDWNGITGIASRKYICGHCGNPLASEKGWWGRATNAAPISVYIYICHQCGKPTYFDMDGQQTPGYVFGKAVDGIPDQLIVKLYDEARRTTSIGAFTAAVLCCRKILMHVAVSKGAAKDQSFIQYVQFLADNHYIPPDALSWVDHIRTKGNEANHEILIMGKEDAEDLISFVEMLLKVIFEFPAIAKRKSVTP